jgi:hypothetical protein
VATQLVLEHQFSLPPDSTMAEAALEMIAADADLFSGFNEIPLRQAFCARAILTSNECNPPLPATTFVYAAKDALLRQSNVTRNEGASPLLRIRAGAGTHSRAVVGFDLSGLDLGTVKAATLEMTIGGNDGAWPAFGATLEAYGIAKDFTEGNGVFIGAAPAVQTLGSGAGATWNCANDTDIANRNDDCAPGDVWLAGASPGSPFPIGTGTPPAVIGNGMTSGKLRWSVTADVKNGISRWVVAKTFGDTPGIVDFYSKEGALALDPGDAAARRPRLLITLN